MKNPASSLVLIVFLSFLACTSRPGENESSGPPIGSADNVPVTEVYGDYVDDSYARREDGYDFVTVSIFEGSGKPAISVRSRSDRKRATCTYFAQAERVSDRTLKTTFEGQEILFTVQNDTLRISTPPGKDNTVLYYFCSGGGTLEGAYAKLTSPLDERLLSPFKFNRTLRYGDYLFDVSATMGGSQNKLVIQPYGLEISNEKAEHSIDGNVVNAEIGDLNIDGFPEILVYFTSAGSGAYGDIIGSSVNNGKTMTMISVPEIHNNAEASKGYMGHDEFAIVESTLARRFPVYRDGDSTASPSGGMRQIQYKLEEGEAMRQLVIDKIVEF